MSTHPASETSVFFSLSISVTPLPFPFILHGGTVVQDPAGIEREPERAQWPQSAAMGAEDWGGETGDRVQLREGKRRLADCNLEAVFPARQTSVY